MLATADLDTAATELVTRYGLASIEGGRHPGWGTANRIVPLGESYLELVAVVDEIEAAQSTFGSWVADARPSIITPLGWAVRTLDLNEVARRLGLPIEAGSRKARSGRLLRWRLAGVEQSAADPSLPFFMEWGRDAPLPGRTPVDHPAGDMKIEELRLDGDAERLQSWLGVHELPIDVRPGTPALRSVDLSGAAGAIAVTTVGS